MRGKFWTVPAVLAVVFACGGLRGDEETIRWRSNLDTALREASQSGRLVLVHFWATWCGPCRRLDSTVYRAPGVGEALESRYVPVKLDADEFAALARQFGITSIPTDVILNGAGQPIGRLACPPDVNQYLAQLSQFAEQSGIRPPAPASSEFVTQPLQGQIPAAGGIAPAPSWSGGAPINGPAPPAGSNSGQAPVGPGFMPVGQPAVSSPAGQPPTPNAPPTTAATAGGPASANGRPGALGSPPITGQGPPAPHAGSASANPAIPEFGLDGYCPVQLLDGKQWVRGDRRWGAIHRGVTFLFAGPQEQQRFLADPDRYAPVLNGCDPVQLMDNRQTLMGRREHGVYYQNRVYLFASPQTRDVFARNPERYSYNTLQAQRIIAEHVRR